MGWIGRQRLESVAASRCAEIVAIADPVPCQCAQARHAAPGAILCGSLDDLLAQDLDGIVIATPSALHAAQVTAALERGCAVFCQKPLGRTASEVQALIASARQADRLLAVDLSYRHTRALQGVRERILSGQLGRVFAAHLIFHNAYGPDKPWFYDRSLSGGGCVIDLGVHLVDAALWILGGEATAVASHLLRAGLPLSPHSPEVEDYASTLLRLDSGAVVNLACSWRLHAGQPAVIEASFYGTEGGASLRNVNGSFTDFRAERFSGTGCEVLAEPPDDWGGGAILAWTQRLAQSPRYHSSIEEHLAVARVLDRIYGCTETPAALTGSTSMARRGPSTARTGQ